MKNKIEIERDMFERLMYIQEAKGYLLATTESAKILVNYNEPLALQLIEKAKVLVEKVSLEVEKLSDELKREIGEEE